MCGRYRLSRRNQLIEEYFETENFRRLRERRFRTPKAQVRLLVQLNGSAGDCRKFDREHAPTTVESCPFLYLGAPNPITDLSPPSLTFAF